MSIILCIDCELVREKSANHFCIELPGTWEPHEACLGCIEMLLVAGETIALQRTSQLKLWDCINRIK